MSYIPWPYICLKETNLSKECLSRTPMQKVDDANITVPHTHNCVLFAYYRNCQWKQGSLDKDRSRILVSTRCSRNPSYSNQIHTVAECQGIKMVLAGDGGGAAWRGTMELAATFSPWVLRALDHLPFPSISTLPEKIA